MSLYNASIYAGMVICHTGTSYCHSLGYFLSEQFDFPHGYACAVYLPHYISLGERFYPKKAQSLFNRLSTSLDGPCSLIYKCNNTVIPSGLDKDYLTDIANRYTDSNNFLNSPGDFNTEQAVELLHDMYL